MVSSAPPRTIQTLSGLMMARVCTGEECVLSQVELQACAYEDGRWCVLYWDPSDLTRRTQAVGTDECGEAAVRAMLDAIAALTPVRS